MTSVLVPSKHCRPAAAAEGSAAAAEFAEVSSPIRAHRWIPSPAVDDDAADATEAADAPAHRLPGLDETEQQCWRDFRESATQLCEGINRRLLARHAEIAASRDQLLDAISRLFDVAQAGEVISCDERSLLPRNQLRCAQRAVAAVDAIFAGSGGNAACKSNPLQRFWRDAHVGLGHAVHLSDMIYQSSALTAMGGQAP